LTVSILVITHNQIGAELLTTATRMFGHCPLAASTINVTEYDDPDLLLARARRLAEELDDGSGLLILTDLFGSTPANVANSIRQGHQVRVLTGVNLPMLVRALNYHSLDLCAITEKALSGGREGVLLCQFNETSP
jgi:PTS system ascorbate-specific IIA component